MKRDRSGRLLQSNENPTKHLPLKISKSPSFSSKSTNSTCYDNLSPIFQQKPQNDDKDVKITNLRWFRCLFRFYFNLEIYINV